MQLLIKSVVGGLGPQVAGGGRRWPGAAVLSKLHGRDAKRNKAATSPVGVQCCCVLKAIQMLTPLVCTSLARALGRRANARRPKGLKRRDPRDPRWRSFSRALLHRIM